MSKILIADDEKDMVSVLRERLEAEGFETLVAYEGVRAIEMAHKKSPDLILLDLKMPAGRGQSVLEALRSRSDTEKIPVIILTALVEAGLREQLLAKGAQDFLQKPCDVDQLLDKIRSLLT